MVIGICIILIAWLVEMPLTLSVLLTVIGGWKIVLMFFRSTVELVSVGDSEDDSEIEKDLSNNE